MNWASYAILALGRGETCTVTPHGNSMRPLVESGATVTLARSWLSEDEWERLQASVKRRAG